MDTSGGSPGRDRDGQNEYRIGNTPRFDQIMERIHALETRLRARDIRPDRILVGTDLYLVLDMRVREGLGMLVTGQAGQSTADSIRGMELICDPLLPPMEMRVIGSNQDNAFRALAVREANTL